MNGTDEGSGMKQYNKLVEQSPATPRQWRKTVSKTISARS